MATKVKEVLVLELTDRSPSDFILEGTEKDANPVRRDGPTYRRIMPTSTVREADREGNITYRKIRHIQGAPTIYVDEQEKQKLTFNSRRDQIFFDSTIKTVVRDGRDINMFDYLKACEFNEHAPQYDDKNHTPTNVVFREVRAQEIAKSDISILKYKAEAAQIVAELYDIGPDGKNVYDLDAMNRISQVLGIPRQDSPEETLRAISITSDMKPDFFVESLANITVDYRADVNESLSLGVLSFDGKIASLPSTQAVIKTLRAKEKGARIDELIRFFLTPDGAIFLKQMRAELEAKRAEILAT